MNREQKIDYLKTHFRYFTMNSWNRSTSYAANVKIHNFVPRELRDKAYAIMEQGDVYDEIRSVLNDFDQRYEYRYQISFNGRSDGYLVMINGGEHDDGRIFTQPGKDIDQSANYEDWDNEYLTDRVWLVKDFDKTVKECQNIFIEYCRNYEVEEETVQVPKVIKVLKAV